MAQQGCVLVLCAGKIATAVGSAIACGSLVAFNATRSSYIATLAYCAPTHTPTPSEPQLVNLTPRATTPRLASELEPGVSAHSDTAAITDTDALGLVDGESKAQGPWA